MQAVWAQHTIRLNPRRRGCHLITGEILGPIRKDLSSISMGLCNVFLQHTSASLCINENADPDVRVDMASALDRLAPEASSSNGIKYIHADEGPDDMPAHIKATIINQTLTVPITNGRLNMGTWQGFWLAEHRDSAGPRTVVVTLTGTARA